MWSFYLHSYEDGFLSYLIFNFFAFFFVFWITQILFLQFYSELKFSKNLSRIKNPQSEFFNRAWIRASNAYLNRQNARSFEDLVNYKGVLAELENLKKTLKNPASNPDFEKYKTAGLSQKFVQNSFLQYSKEIEGVQEEETRLIEELKLYTFLEMKSEIFKEKTLLVKFIEEFEKKLEEKGCNFNISSLNLDNYKPIERYDILDSIFNKFNDVQVISSPYKIYFI